MKATTLLLSIFSLFSTVKADTIINAEININVNVNVAAYKPYVPNYHYSDSEVTPIVKETREREAKEMKERDERIIAEMLEVSEFRESYLSNRVFKSFKLNEELTAIVSGGVSGYKVSIGHQVFSSESVIRLATGISPMSNTETYSFKLNEDCEALIQGDKVIIGKHSFDTQTIIEISTLLKKYN